MITRILLATDGSACSNEAVAFLCDLGLPAGTLVQVTCVVDAFIESLLQEAHPTGRDFPHRVVEEAVTRLTVAGLEACYEIRRGDAAHQIILAAKAFAADLVVVGSRGLNGLAAFVLGSVARNVAQYSDRSVLVVRSGDRPHADAVVLALDESNSAARAAQLAAWLPMPAGTFVTALNVARPMQPLVGLAAVGDTELFERLREAEARSRAAGEELVSKACGRLQAAGKKCRGEVRVGDPATEILALCEKENARLLIAGARGVSPLEGLILGSVAERVLKKGRCSMLLAR